MTATLRTWDPYLVAIDTVIAQYKRGLIDEARTWRAIDAFLVARAEDLTLEAGDEVPS
jgi:hypothetical protein